MKLYFAPMEGITGYVFRNAYAACYGGIDVFFTPFLSNPVLNQIESGDVLPDHNSGLRVVPQILTNKPVTFRRIADTLEEYGYPEVNLNLGCPSGTVVAKNRGCGALREPKELNSLLDGIFQMSPLPVSVKCRIGLSSEAEWEDILEVLLRYPLKELIIHPRLQKEFYQGEIHMDAFRTAYERCLPAGIPLVYNGDIRTKEDYHTLKESYPELAGVMLGRGLLWNPRLAEEIRTTEDETAMERLKDTETEESKDTGKSATLSRDDREVLRHFLDLLCEGYRQEMSREGPALAKLKELWSYLQVYIGRSPKEMRPLWKTKTLAEYRDVVNMLL